MSDGARSHPPPAQPAIATASPGAAAAGRHWSFDFLLLSAIWGSSFLFMRLSTVEFGPAPTAWVRVGVAALFLLPLMWLRGQGPVLRKHWKEVLLIGVFNSGLPFLCFAFALLSITSGLSSILNATVPLFGAVIAWLWLRDTLSTDRVAGLTVGFAGVAMLAWDQASFKPGASGIAPGWAILACLLAAVSYAVSATATKRYLGGLPALALAAGSQLGATLALALPALWTWPARSPSLQAWLAVIMVGVLCTGVAYVMYFRVIELAGPTRALTVTFVVPVFAVFYGALFLDEPVTAWMLICGAVIVCGTALSTGLLHWARSPSTMTSARRIKLRTTAPKPRNPLVAATRQRKAGSHRKSESTRRGESKRELKRQLKEMG